MGVSTGAAAGPAVSGELAALLAGRDTRWYKGNLARLTVGIVSFPQRDTAVRAGATRPVA